jgi:hypothetical protein
LSAKKSTTVIHGALLYKLPNILLLLTTVLRSNGCSAIRNLKQTSLPTLHTIDLLPCGEDCSLHILNLCECATNRLIHLICANLRIDARLKKR